MVNNRKNGKNIRTLFYILMEDELVDDEQRKSNTEIGESNTE